MSDNGTPFNSTEWEVYSKKRGFYAHQVTQASPWANGLAEQFMKMLQKLVWTAVTEKMDPRAVVNDYLMAYRATPHQAIGKSPAEALFNRPFRTSLPSLIPRPCDDDLR